jgi:Tol biopolymer transport system component
MLPPGLTLSVSGTITGTPTAAGTTTFTVEVHDESNPPQMAAATLSLDVVNPAPTITTLTPSSATAGDPDLTLTVDGMDFVPGAEVQWNGSPRTPSTVGPVDPGLGTATQVTVSIPAIDIAVAGTAQVQVWNPSPGGGVSNMLPFRIDPPGLRITTPPLTPGVVGYSYTTTMQATGGTPPYSWSLSSGSMLPPGLVLAENGDVAGTPTAAGTTSFTVEVRDSASPPRTASATRTLDVVNPRPRIDALTPSSATAGDPGFTLTVDGADFVPGAEVEWNGARRTPETVGPVDPLLGTATQLTVNIKEADVQFSGDAQVQVRNPDPGGGLSDGVPFRINPPGNPAPVLVSISPLRQAAGGPALTLTLRGSGFIAGSVVQWDSGAGPQPRSTSFFSADLLTAHIPESDVATIGAAQVMVLNPAPGGGTSEARTFTIDPPVPPGGVLERISVNSRREEAVDGLGRPSQRPAMSADGRYVAFQSPADNLDTNAPDTNMSEDVFVRDTCGKGAPPGCMPQTIRVSVLSDGSEPADPGESIRPALSGDGQLVAFDSTADLDNSGTFLSDASVFVRDRDADSNGRFDEPGGVRIRRVSVDWADQPRTGCCPAMTPNGRFIAFVSGDPLVQGDENNVPDVFVRDTCRYTPAGCTPWTLLASLAIDGRQTDKGVSGRAPAISADGRFVAFSTAADDLLGPGNDTNGIADVFVRDTCVNGPPGCRPTTVRVSVASDGSQATSIGVSGGSGLTGVAISANGRFVAFDSMATNLVPNDDNNVSDIFLHDRDADEDGVFDEAGAILTLRVSVNSLGVYATATTGHASSPSLSADGRFVAFAAEGLGGPSAGFNDAWVHDQWTRQTFLVSLDSSGMGGNDFTDMNGMGTATSADGRLVCFTSSATNFVAGDTNDADDVFLASSGRDPSPPVPKVGIMGPPGLNGTLAVRGSSFMRNAVVQWDGVSLSTAFIDSTWLQADVPTSLLTAGTHQGTVFNPAPCECLSNVVLVVVDP